MIPWQRAAENLGRQKVYFPSTQPFYETVTEEKRIEIKAAAGVIGELSGLFSYVGSGHCVLLLSIVHGWETAQGWLAAAGLFGHSA